MSIAQQPLETRGTGPMQSRRHTLLVVDDESAVVDSVRDLFYRKYRVLTATTAVGALELLGNSPHAVHVILSDQRMPGMTGDEFLARARHVAPDAIRLLFTGYADIQAVINAVNHGGIFRYILKPWQEGELEAAIQQATELYDLIADRRRLVAELQEANAQLTRANHELAEANQLKTAFLEVASHELNTPLTIVHGYIDLLLLQSDARGGPDSAMLAQARESTLHLIGLVGNMFKLVTAGEFRERLHAVPTDLPGLITGSIAHVRPFITARSLKVHESIDNRIGTFEIDPNKVRDVLLNLLTNAIKFTPDHGEITVSATLIQPDEVEVRVADNGIGLDSRALGRLFSPFFTEFDPKSHSTGVFGFGKRGLGLGLYLVKTFIEMHGGSVAASSALGQGTEVTLRLPRTPCRTAATAVE